jgi:predicted O-linked N-acetylglucosamine transferase (SPINDLY family)
MMHKPRAAQGHTALRSLALSPLPLVTKLGQGFAARVAASLLRAVDLPELITQTEDEYESLILQLANNPKLLNKIRSKLGQTRLSAPLFDTERYTTHLEDAYQQAYQQYADGKPSKNILVTDQLISEA